MDPIPSFHVAFPIVLITSMFNRHEHIFVHLAHGAKSDLLCQYSVSGLKNRLGIRISKLYEN